MKKDVEIKGYWWALEARFYLGDAGWHGSDIHNGVITPTGIVYTTIVFGMYPKKLVKKFLVELLGHKVIMEPASKFQNNIWKFYNTGFQNYAKGTCSYRLAK